MGGVVWRQKKKKERENQLLPAQSPVRVFSYHDQLLTYSILYLTAQTAHEAQVSFELKNTNVILFFKI